MNRPLIVLLLAGISAPALADPAPRFDLEHLSVDGNVLIVVPADVDGDGKEDLVAVYTNGPEPTPPRYFGVFWNKGGSFNPRPDVTLRIDDKACAFDIADIDDAPGAELITVGRDGVSSIHFAGRKHDAPVAIVGEATVFYRPDAKALPRVHLVHELSGKRSKQLVVPLLGAIGVYARTGTRWSAIGHLPIEGKSTILLDDRLTRSASFMPTFDVTFHYPAVHVADIDGDGVLDLVAATEDRVTMFRQLKGGTFDEHPAFSRDFAVRTQAEAARVVQAVSTTVQDFDGDGVADLVISKLSGRGLTAAATTNFVYLGHKGGGYDDKPDQTLKIDGLGGGDIEPMDLTGDQHADLIVPTITMGVWAVIRMLTTKMVVVKFEVFPFGTQRRFLDTPVVRELKFKFSLTGDTDLPAVEMHGDYNGDKRPDLAFGINDTELGIFPGTADGSIITKDPIEKVKVDSRGRLAAVDLLHKGKDDLVVFYPSTIGHRSEIVVLDNRGAW